MVLGGEGDRRVVMGRDDEGREAFAGPNLPYAAATDLHPWLRMSEPRADVGAPQTTEELLAQWRSALKAGARQMLDLLVDAYPDGLSRAELAERSGYEITGGTFGTYLGTL